MARKFSRISALAPWRWQGVSGVFAVHPPSRSNPSFVCFGNVGPSGEEGIAIADGFDEFLSYAELRDARAAFIGCYWRDGGLTNTERRLCELSGIPADKDGRLPVFVSHRPGWTPWTLSPDEVLHATEILDQALGVFLRMDKDGYFINSDRPGYVWVRCREKNSAGWSEGWVNPGIYRSASSANKVVQDGELIDLVSSLPDTLDPVSVDARMVPGMICAMPSATDMRGEGGRLPLGYFCSITPYGSKKRGIDRENSAIVYPGDGAKRFDLFLQQMLLEHFKRHGARARQVVVPSLGMMKCFEPLQFIFPMKITIHKDNPQFEAAYSKICGLVARKLKEKGLD